MVGCQSHYAWKIDSLTVTIHQIADNLAFLAHNRKFELPGSSLITRLLKLLLCCGLVATARADIVFQGLNTQQEINARALSPLASTTCETARWRVERLFRDADKGVRKSLEALGYYSPEISKSLSFPSEGCWQAVFTVVPGEPVRLRNIDVTLLGDIDKDPAFLKRIEPSALTAGHILNHGLYEDYKRLLLGGALASGYFDADLTLSEVIVDPDTRTADVKLQIDGGSRYRFGPTTFTTGILDQSLLQGYNDIQQGAWYDASAINDLYEGLSGSNYFSSVSIKAEPDETTAGEVPVIVTLLPSPRKHYTAGIGFSSNTGPQGKLSYADIRRNSKGHQLEGRLFMSDVNQELSASYRWPRKNPRSEWLSVFGGVQREQTDTSDLDKINIGIRQTRSVNKNWLETRYITAATEKFTIGLQESTSHLIIPGITWSSSEGRVIGRVLNGKHISLDIRGANQMLASDTSFLQVTGTAKWIFRAGEKGRVLTRFSAGTTLKESFRELPASVRYFAGGDNSVRGYGFETLGPTDDLGNVIGGSHLAIASIEFDRLVAEKWSVAAFVDTGNAFDTSVFKMATGVGLGLRWYSPVGPIRVDIAHPIDDPNRQFRLHITLGPDL